MNYKAPRGTSDILGPEVELQLALSQKAREIFKLFAYKEIVTPIFEDSRLFVRSLGDTSDIVTKQMLNLEGKDNPLTLRPEGTACVIRAYLEHNLDKEGFQKLFYIGPMFRGERPQKGRLRQFNHIGAEAIGSASPALDAEVLILVTRLLKVIGLDDYTINLNSVGCQKDKEKLKALLRNKLGEKNSGLCSDCQVRLNKNVLRILDCKNDACKKIVGSIDFHNSFRCPDCEKHFEDLKKFLAGQRITYKELPFLVRGLDYYTGTVFEITHPGLGSQDALGAGGRYDNLVKELGGPEVGAIGFALGVERLIIALKGQQEDIKDTKAGPDVFVVITKEEFFDLGLSILTQIRDSGISCEIDYTSRSLKAQMRLANNSGARLVAMIGDDEVRGNSVSLKDMQTGSQEACSMANMTIRIKELLKI